MRRALLIIAASSFLLTACTSVGVAVGSVRGIVRIEGEPLPGATVSLSLPNASELATTTTNARGEFEIAGIPGGSEVIVSAQIEGTRAESLEVPSLKPNETRFLVLQVSMRCVVIVDCTVTSDPPTSASLTGRVLSMDGAPVRGAVVEVASGSTRTVQVTGAEGRFGFEGLPLGRHEFTVTHRDHIGRRVETCTSICEPVDSVEIFMVQR